MLISSFRVHGAVSSWHFASYRGDAAVRSLLEDTVEKVRRRYLAHRSLKWFCTSSPQAALTHSHFRVDSSGYWQRHVKAA
jgi:hypothetical protein